VSALYGVNAAADARKSLLRMYDWSCKAGKFVVKLNQLTNYYMSNILLHLIT